MKRTIKYNILEGDPNFISSNNIWVDKDKNSGKIKGLKIRDPEGTFRNIVDTQTPLQSILKESKVEYAELSFYKDVLDQEEVLKKYEALPNEDGILKYSVLFSAFVGSTQKKFDKELVYYLPKVELDSTGSSTPNLFAGWYSIREIEELIIPDSYTGQFSTFFYNSSSLQRIRKKIKLLPNIINVDNAFQGCSSLKEFPLEDTRNIQSMKGFLTGCYSLTNITLDLSSIAGPTYAEIFKGSNGSEYLTDVTIRGTIYVNLSYLVFGYCNNLTVNSLLSIINALADYSNGETHKAILGPTNLAKLSQEQIQIATNKNWTLS